MPDWKTGTPSRRELAALLRSARRSTPDPDGREWTVRRLARELRAFADGAMESVTPRLAEALATIRGSGSNDARTFWAEATIYGNENFKGNPTPGQEFVWLYDQMFAGGQGHLLERWAEVQISDPPRSRPSRLPNSRYPLPGDRSVHVCDVTVRDFMIVPTNFRFTKTWRLLNAGTVEWRNRRLARVGTNVSLGNVRSAAWVPIPDTQPGQMVDISVDVRAPSVATTETESRWRMVDEHGDFYFPQTPYGIGMVISAAEGAPEPASMDCVNAETLTGMFCANFGQRCLRLSP